MQKIDLSLYPKASLEIRRSMKSAQRVVATWTLEKYEQVQRRGITPALSDSQEDIPLPSAGTSILPSIQTTIVKPAVRTKKPVSPGKAVKRALNAYQPPAKRREFELVQLDGEMKLPITGFFDVIQYGLSVPIIRNQGSEVYWDGNTRQQYAKLDRVFEGAFFQMSEAVLNQLRNDPEMLRDLKLQLLQIAYTVPQWVKNREQIISQAEKLLG